MSGLTDAVEALLSGCLFATFGVALLRDVNGYGAELLRAREVARSTDSPPVRRSAWPRSLEKRARLLLFASRACGAVLLIGAAALLAHGLRVLA